MLEATESNYFHPRFVQSFYTLAFQPKNPITGPFISDPDLRSNFDYFHSSGNEGVQPGQPSEIFLGIENRWNPPGCPMLQREKLIFLLNEKMLCTGTNKAKLTKRACQWQIDYTPILKYSNWILVTMASVSTRKISPLGPMIWDNNRTIGTWWSLSCVAWLCGWCLMASERNAGIFMFRKFEIWLIEI